MQSGTMRSCYSWWTARCNARTGDLWRHSSREIRSAARVIVTRVVIVQAQRASATVGGMLELHQLLPQGGMCRVFGHREPVSHLARIHPESIQRFTVSRSWWFPQPRLRRWVDRTQKSKLWLFFFCIFQIGEVNLETNLIVFRPDPCRKVPHSDVWSSQFQSQFSVVHRCGFKVLPQQLSYKLHPLALFTALPL